MLSTPGQQYLPFQQQSNAARGLSFRVSKSLLRFVTWIFKLEFAVRVGINEVVYVLPTTGAVNHLVS